jgi:HJR/Mrr/RecB family endonuclease
VGRDTYYDILGVSPTSPPEQIKAKYRALIQRVHPDLGGPIALFRLVQESYEVLSDPVRRASYDRALGAVHQRDRARGVKARQARETPARTRPPRRSATAPSRTSTSRLPHGKAKRVPNRHAWRMEAVRNFLHDFPARVAAIAGAGCLALGAALVPGVVGWSALVLGVAVLILATVAGLGARGRKEREAYRRGGMAAVDAMTGRQFRALLEHYFARQGYRVARLGVGGDVGADLLISDPHGRTIVQLKRWSGVVSSEAVQRAMVAKARFGVSRVLMVTSSSYSEQAVLAANSNGITLWNRSMLNDELSLFDGDQAPVGLKRLTSDLQVGTRMCLTLAVALFMAVLAARTKERRREQTREEGVSSQP